MKRFWRPAVLAVAYFLLASLGMRIRAATGYSAIYWLPSGLGLAALTVWGRSLWPAIAVAAFLANVIPGRPLGASLFLAATNSLEPLLGSWLLQKYGAERPTLGRVREALVLISLGAALSNFIGVLCEAPGLWALGVLPASAFFANWRSWWLAQTLGSIIFGGALLA